MNQVERSGAAGESLHQIGVDLAQRLVQCLPAATFEMETLVRLTGIEASREIATAAVTCGGRSRLLLNPDFVAEHCQRDEHLFLLAMHELWHVILAHTRLYPRPTPAHNIAFDAVINAGLAAQFSAPEYRGFLEALNPADSFPGLLLRPPLGWPEKPNYDVPGPPGTGFVLKRLYPAPSHGEVEMPTYAEILELIEKSTLEEAIKARKVGPAVWAAGEERAPAPFLLGDHEDTDGEERALDDPLFGEVVREIVSAWPPPPIPLRGRDAGGDPYDWVGALRSPGVETQRAFATVLRRVLGRSPGRAGRPAREMQLIPGALGPLPNPADRTVAARRALGISTLLRQQLTLTPVRTREHPASAHVYLDVSGSMFALLPHIAGLLAPHVAAGRARCFQFSNRVLPISRAELSAGRLTTTGGTEINCVLEHWLGEPSVHKALILTDGFVGRPRDDLAEALRTRGLRLHAVLPGESAWKDDLSNFAASITVLPPLVGRPSPSQRRAS